MLTNKCQVPGPKSRLSEAYGAPDCGSAGSGGGVGGGVAAFMVIKTPVLKIAIMENSLLYICPYAPYWSTTLLYLLVLGSYYSGLYLKSLLFSGVYSKLLLILKKKNPA